MASGPENKFRKRFTDLLHANWASVYVQKNHGSEFSAGLPDLEVLFRGQQAWLELKASKRPKRHDSIHIDLAQVSALQVSCLKRIYDAGGNAAVLWFLDSGRRGGEGSLAVRIPAQVVIDDYAVAEVQGNPRTTWTLDDIDLERTAGILVVEDWPLEGGFQRLHGLTYGRSR